MTDEQNKRIKDLSGLDILSIANANLSPGALADAIALYCKCLEVVLQNQTIPLLGALTEIRDDPIKIPEIADREYFRTLWYSCVGKAARALKKHDSKFG